MPAADRELFQSLAELCAEALRRVRSQDRGRQSELHAATLRRATEAFSRAVTLDDVLIAMIEITADASGTCLCGGLAMEAGRTIGYRLEAGAVHPLERDKPIVAHPASIVTHFADPGRRDGAALDEVVELFGAPGARPWAGGDGFCVPLRVDGAVVGAIGCAFEAGCSPQPAALELVVSLAALGAEAVRRAALYEEERRAAARAMALHRVTRALSRATTMDEVVRVGVSELHEVLGAASTLAGVVRGDALVLVDVLGELADRRAEVAVVPLTDERPATLAVRTGRAVWYDEEHPLVGVVSVPKRWRSGALVPFMVDGEALGVLGVGFDHAPQVSQADRDVIESVVSLCSEALRRARLFEQATAAAVRYELLFDSYERLFARHPQPIAVFDEQGEAFLAVNEALAETFGYRAEELLACAPDQLLHPSARDVIRRRRDQPGEEPTERRLDALLRMQRRDGSTFFAEVTSSPVDFGGRRAFAVLMTDQTAWVQTEAERQRLQERVVTVAEEERRRISLDLHDGAVQDLSAVAMRLAALRRGVQRGELPPLEKLVAIERSTEATVNALRGLMQQLYPTSFESRTLGELIADVLPAAPWAGSLEVVVRDLLSEPVPLLEKAALYRVVVEALANVQKHARATVAVVELSCHGDVFAVRITDDGIGIDRGEVLRTPQGHFGLTSMRDRISLLGGRCVIAALPDGGTVVQASVPARRAQDAVVDR